MAKTIARRVKRFKRKKGKFKRLLRRGVKPLKRNTKQRRMVSIGRGFPKKMLTTHVYEDTVKLSWAAGVPTFYTESANGLFDPDPTVVTHQPFYFDQLAALYDHYVVIGSRIDMQVVPGTATTVPFQFCGFLNDDTTVTPTNPTWVGELPQGFCQVIGSGASTGMRRFTLKWSAKKVFGGSILANTELQGTPTTNPTEQSFFTFGVKPVDQTTAIDVFVQVRISYVAIWKELKEVAQST